MTVVAGIPIQSSSPYFLAGVAVHVFFGLTCVVCGAVAMLSPKRRGRHPTFGTIYFWSLSGVFVTASALAVIRWSDDRALFILAALSFSAAVLGRQARRRQWKDWPRWHMTGLGVSYMILLTAFYVDNGKNLPIWRELPTAAYWVAPSLIGLPILALAFFRHPLVRRAR